MDDFILNEEQYLELKNKYDELLIPKPNFSINELNQLILCLQNNNLKMPLSLQNKIYSQLLQAKEILNIVYTNQPTGTHSEINNIFKLIHHLCSISKELTANTLKSPHQILQLKANNLILECLVEISKYFSDKKIKIFKFY